MITNQANVNYTYVGARTSQDRDSNITRLELVSANQIELIKFPLGETYIPGENHGYILRIENTGTNQLDNVTLTDDLGQMSNYLEYVEGSTAYSRNNSPWAPITPTSIDPLVFEIGTLESGEVYEIVFLARTTDNTEVTSITNNATVTGGDICERVTSDASSTITAKAFARLEIVKTQSSDNPSIGEDFSYRITLTNTGNLDATHIIVTDNLPNEFDLDSIEMVRNGTTTTLNPSDYTYENNLLTIPSNSSSLDFVVPAGDQLTFILNGTFTENDDNNNAPTV